MSSRFRVHYSINGQKASTVIQASEPDQARRILQNKVKPEIAIISKVKLAE